jgi:hypothetical protein
VNHPMTKALALLATALLWAGTIQAQPETPFSCLANDPEMLAELHGNDPEELARIAQAEAELEAWTQEFALSHTPGQRVTYVIPVVFHIIHDNGPENILDEQLYDAIRVLNEDFNKLNPDWPTVKPEFLDLVADVGIEFRLARKDPQGNCTNGITRTESVLTYQGNQQMKSLIQWPRSRYMNVWVAASANGAAGYTNYPSAFNNFPQADGIVLLHNYTGSIGTSDNYRSRTLTHEVGHWLNLPHVWGNSNNPGLESNCSTDDGVADTPNTVGWTSCALNGQSCGSLDNVQNYMDYSYCSRMFTNGQATRMLAALTSSVAQRSTLWQPATLALTGVEEEPVLCEARFIQTTGTLCAGNTVTYTDVSYHGVQDRNWEFPGGTPATSTEANPTVTYTQAGTYPVTLTVSDGTSTLSTTVEQVINVLADPGATPPIMESFEDHSDLASSPWTTTGGDGGFELTTAAAFTGDKSVWLVNNANLQGAKYNLLSATYDMSDATVINISLRYAFAPRASFNDDRLRIHVSSNCGQTWSLRKQLRAGVDLSTSGVTGGNFVPNGPGQWGYTEVSITSSSFRRSDFRLRLEFESDGGNNLYIDDININGAPVSVEELWPGGMDGLQVLPNPVSGPAQAVYGLAEAGPVRIELLDVLGRGLGVVHEGWSAAGPQRIDLPVEGLRSGIYLLRLQHQGRNQVVRFVVE